MEESVPQLKTATSSAAMLQRQVPSVVDKALGRAPNSVESSNPLVYSSSTMPFSRSQSVKIPVEHGSATVERFASRPSSRLKTRNGGEEFPADLQDDDAPHLHQYARDREGRTKSRGGGGARNGVDIADLDAFDGYGAAAAAPIKEERASSRSSSRMKGRSSSRDTAAAAAAAVGSYTGLQQEDEDLQLRASNIVVRSANGMDMADVEGYLYGMRSLQSTPRFRSSASAASMDPQPEKAATTTTRSRSTSSSSSSRNANAKDTQEELRALHEVVKEIRRSNAARRSVASARGLGESTDAMEDMNLQRASLKSPRTSSSSFSYSQREAPDSLADERLSRAERHARKHQQQKSPRKLKADNTENQLIHRESSTGAAALASEYNNTSRQATNGRLSRGEWEELQQSDDGGAYEEEEIAATQRQSRAAAPRQQHKHRPVVHDHPSPQELLTTTPPAPMLLPVSHPPECELLPEMLVAAAPSSLEQIPLNWSSATMPTTEESFSTMNVGWLQALVDLIMWRDIPRSALWFGAGSFIILSTSFMPRIRCGLIGIGANFALFYLATIFIYRMFIPGSASQLREDNVGMVCCTTEADIVQWIRIFLPAINLVLMKTRQVFSGEPATTLKVAAVLWLLARAGSRMSLWSFVRLCYFGVFTVPKCCNCYSNQLQAHGQSIAVRAWMAWSTYSHKKAVLVVAFLLAWNMSSFSTRLWGGFMMLVWLRLYQQSHPLVFEEAVSGVSCSMGAIDLSNHQEILQQTIKAKPESVEDARQQEDPAALVKMEQVQKFPGREVNSYIYKA